jgi:hypothetical protein
VLGQWIEDGTLSVFLAGRQGTVRARQGDVLAEHFRIEQIGDSRLSIVYIPMNHRYELPLPAAR